VIENHTHTAQLVAEHFLERGFSRFMFYNRTNQWACQKRGEAFIESLKRSGYGCICFQWHQLPLSYSLLEQRKQC
jgi:DNA-binding LacI/PurR family transcriptional regulator